MRSTIHFPPIHNYLLIQVPKHPSHIPQAHYVHIHVYAQVPSPWQRDMCVEWDATRGRQGLPGKRGVGRGDKLEGELDCTKCLIHTHAHTQHISTYMHHTHPHYTSYTQAHPYTHATHIPTLMYHTRMQHTPQQVNTHVSHLYSCIKHMHHTPTHCCAPHAVHNDTTHIYISQLHSCTGTTHGWLGHVGRGRSRFQIEFSSDPSIIVSKGQSQLANLLK